MGEIQRPTKKMPTLRLSVWFQVQTFYNGLGSTTRTMIDDAARGTLMGKTPEVAYELLEEMASNNYQWSSEWSIPTTKENCRSL